MSDAKVIDMHLYRVHGVTSEEQYRRDYLEALKKRIRNGPPAVFLDFDRQPTESEPSDG